MFHVKHGWEVRSMGGDWEIFRLQLAALGGLLFLSLSVTWIILYYVRLLDHPNERSSHTLATPKCGGVGIVTCFLVGVGVSQLWGGTYQVGLRLLFSLLIPTVIVATISLLDDIHEISPRIRLVVQVVAALLFLYLGKITMQVGSVGVPGILLQSFFWGACVLWLVGMANTFNFMDGIDGLAAGQGLIVALFFGVIQYERGDYFIGFVSLVLLVACLGFLAFNFPPAKVFMGDVGSVSIGFTLAMLVLLALARKSGLVVIAEILILMFNFVFDTATTLGLRLLKKENVFKPHKLHLYQKMIRCDFSHRTVTMTHYGMVLIQGIMLLLFSQHMAVVAFVILSIQLVYATVVNKRYKQRQERNN